MKVPVWLTLTFLTPTAQTRALRLGEVNKLTPSHTGKNTSSLVPGLTTLTTLSHYLCHTAL